jgi:xanthine dehydrogenase accessory factor
MKDALAVFRFLRAAVEQRRRVVLVTLTDVVGRAARLPGTHMGVCEDGSFIGAFSGGCVEAAIVAEAQAVLQDGRARQVRFGIGSPYIDIRLPCGGGIDLLFTPDPPLRQLGHATEMLEARRCVGLQLDPRGKLTVDGPDGEGWGDGIFRVIHDPDLRLVIIGQSMETVALARLARSYTPDVAVFSPDPAVLEKVRSTGAAGARLLSSSAVPSLRADAFTAIVFLFHDHDWEGDLLCQALATRSFYIGAMGSEVTRQMRAETLLARGCSQRDIARIHAPIGLIAAARDPDTLAVSILAQIVQEYAGCANRLARGGATRREVLVPFGEDHRALAEAAS